MVLPAPPSRCVGIAPQAGRGSRRLGAGEPQGRSGPGRRLRDPRASSAPRPRRAAPRAGAGGDRAEARGRAERGEAAREGSAGFPPAGRSRRPESGRAAAPPPRDAAVSPVRVPLRSTWALSDGTPHLWSGMLHAATEGGQRRRWHTGNRQARSGAAAAAAPGQAGKRAHAGPSAPAAASATGATPRCVSLPHPQLVRPCAKHVGAAGGRGAGAAGAERDAGCAVPQPRVAALMGSQGGKLVLPKYRWG